MRETADTRQQIADGTDGRHHTAEQLITDKRQQKTAGSMHQIANRQQTTK
jgi:hypothetical protein